MSQPQIVSGAPVWWTKRTRHALRRVEAIAENVYERDIKIRFRDPSGTPVYKLVKAREVQARQSFERVKE